VDNVEKGKQEDIDLPEAPIHRISETKKASNKALYNMLRIKA